MSKFVDALGLRSDLDRLAEVRSKGGRLDILDEQRLRDHQIRRLRRMWLKDQCLSEREPLLPPKKKTFLGELRAKEAKFWSRQFGKKNILDYFYAGKNYNEIPKLFLFKVQRAVRMSMWMLLPAVPIVYYLKYMNTDRDIPRNMIMEKIPVFPGEETIKGKLSEIYLDPHTATFKKKTDE